MPIAPRTIDMGAELAFSDNKLKPLDVIRESFTDISFQSEIALTEDAPAISQFQSNIERLPMDLDDDAEVGGGTNMGNNSADADNGGADALGTEANIESEFYLPEIDFAAYPKLLTIAGILHILHNAVTDVTKELKMLLFFEHFMVYV